MIEWRTSSIEELCEAIVDCVNKTAPTVEGPTPYKMIRTTNVRFGRVNTSNTRYVEADVYERWTRRIVPRRGDVILTREAPLGEVGLVRSDDQIFLGQRTVAYRADKSKSDERFLAYALQGPQVQADLRALGSGSTVEHLRVPDCTRIPITHPDLQNQRRIGNVLGSIDELIENNRQRIEVLEETAQAIYREWFVHFRYPGHEDATFVDSPLGPVPEGWEVQPLGELATIVRGKSYRKYELADEGGLPFVNLKCMMRGGGFRIDGLKRYTGDYKRQQLVSHGDIVLAVTDLTQGREILAQATLVPRMVEEHGVISLDVARILPNFDQERIPLFFALRSTNFADRVKEYANGSTVLHLSPKFVEQNELVWPEQSLRQRFREVSEPMVMILDDLRESAERLASIRDLLLPKLVTGEIDVSELDLDVLVGAAS